MTNTGATFKVDGLENHASSNLKNLKTNPAWNRWVAIKQAEASMPYAINASGFYYGGFVSSTYVINGELSVKQYANRFVEKTYFVDSNIVKTVSRRIQELF